MDRKEVRGGGGWTGRGRKSLGRKEGIDREEVKVE